MIIFYQLRQLSLTVLTTFFHYKIIPYCQLQKWHKGAISRSIIILYISSIDNVPLKILFRKKGKKTELFFLMFDIILLLIFNITLGLLLFLSITMPKSC